MYIIILRKPDFFDLEICVIAARLSHRSRGDDGGPKDIALAKTLIKRGDEHAKSMRGMRVTLEICAPRYWWQEMNTYTIGVDPLGSESTIYDNAKMTTKELVEFKKNLPEGFEQTRIIDFNYQALRRIYKQRKKHRLPEWQAFCDKLEELPFSELITE